MSLVIWGRLSSVNVQKVVWCADELALTYERIDAGGRTINAVIHPSQPTYVIRLAAPTRLSWQDLSAPTPVPAQSWAVTTSSVLAMKAS